MPTNNACSKISGAVLAGGENKRFPVLKSLIKVNGITIIEKNLRLLNSICDEVFISTNTPELYFRQSAVMLGDIVQSRGPMSGIFSSLLNAKNESLFIVACDMPFLSIEVMSLICKRHFEASQDMQYDATVPVYNKMIQPLCGIYSKNILPSLEQHILDGKNSMHLFLKESKTNYIEEPEIRKIATDSNLFININTIEDYETVRRLGSGITLAV